MKKIPLLKSFKLKWGEDASPEDWEETQYARGWSTVGDSPPTVEQFDGVHNIQDAKSNYLYRQLQSVFDDAGIKADAADDKTLLQAFLAVLRKTLSTGDYASKSEMRKKLDKTGKAADSDKLDGHDANYFATWEQLKYKEKYDIGRNKRIEENRKAIGGKVSKTGDDMSGRISVYTGNKDKYPLVLYTDVPAKPQRGDVSDGPILALRDVARGENCDLFLRLTSQIERYFGIHIWRKGEYDHLWRFHFDGHIYGPKGKLVTDSDIDKKLDKSGDTMTGKLYFNDIWAPISLKSHQKYKDGQEFYSMGLIEGIYPNMGNFQSAIYMEERKGRYHSLVIKVEWPGKSKRFWLFRNDGHIYGAHGKIVNAEDEAYSIGSYTIAIVRSTKSFPRNSLVSGAEFFDSDIGGDLGNDFTSERWWLGNRNVGGLPGTWRVMNPINAHGDYRNNSAWCTINLIKRVA